VWHGSPNGDPPLFIMRPATILVNCVIYTNKITQYIRKLDRPLAAMFTRAVHELAHNNNCVPLS
jgi:hypothetical protein